MTIDEILNKLDKDIRKSAQKSYDDILKRIQNGDSPQKAIKAVLSSFEGKAYDDISKALSSVLNASVGSEFIKAMDINGVTLSNTLYKNLKDVQQQTLNVINEHLKQQGTVNDLAKKLYEGYNFKDDPLKTMEKLPKYLTDYTKEEAEKRALKIKTPALRASYLDALDKRETRYYESAMKTAFYEKARHYANRIAQTETFKAYSVGEAKLFMDDNELEVVQYKMSRSHPKRDICDYYANVDKYGLGKGIYPKGKAPLTPIHPFCRCRCVPRYDMEAKGARLNPKADSEYLNSLNTAQASQVVGSFERLVAFTKVKDVESLYNRGKVEAFRVKMVEDVIMSKKYEGVANG